MICVSLIIVWERIGSVLKYLEGVKSVSGSRVYPQSGSWRTMMLMLLHVTIWGRIENDQENSLMRSWSKLVKSWNIEYWSVLESFQITFSHSNKVTQLEYWKVSSWSLWAPKCKTDSHDQNSRNRVSINKQNHITQPHHTTTIKTQKTKSQSKLSNSVLSAFRYDSENARRIEILSPASWTELTNELFLFQRMKGCRRLKYNANKHPHLVSITRM